MITQPREFAHTPTGRPIYTTTAGARVPSVTTVLGNLGWNTDALKYWAWDLGMKGIDFREASDEACLVGKISHAWVEADIKGQPFDLESLPLSPEDKDRVRRSHDAWLEWRELTGLQMVGSEIELVSDELAYGGTLDVAVVGKHRSLLDLKTGGAIYPDHLVQVAAYGHLWNEAFPQQTIERYYLLRVGKEDGSFHFHSWPSDALLPAWRTFCNLLNVHKLRPQLKRMAG
jgi:hypothetical protein